MDQPSPAVHELKSSCFSNRLLREAVTSADGWRKLRYESGLLTSVGRPGRVGARGCICKTSPSLLHTTVSFLFSTVGKSSERASYSTFGRDTGMPGLNQVTIKCIEIFCFIYWLSC